MENSQEEIVVVNINMCRSCAEHQEQLLEEGDGSQVVCDHLHIDCEDDEDAVAAIPVAVVSTSAPSPQSASTPSTTRKRKFMSVSDFEDRADDQTKLRLSSIIKWIELDLDAIYRVQKVHTKTVQEGDSTRIAYYAELRDATEKLINVWITKIIKEKLVTYNLEDGNVYMKALPKRRSKSTGYLYNDFAVVIDA